MLTRPHAARIRDGWLAFVATLSSQECLEYNFMQFFVGCAFHNRVFEDPGQMVYELSTGSDFARKTSWLDWLVLQDGPVFFERALANKEGNQRCLIYICEQWSLVSLD